MDQQTTQRALARIIYDECFHPGEERGDGYPMPPFDEAETDELGAYDWAMSAARKVMEALAHGR